VMGRRPVHPGTPERAAKRERDRRYKKEAYARNKQRILAQSKAWREANPERVRELSAAWKEANPERKAANNRAYYERNNDAVKARQSMRDRLAVQVLDADYVVKNFVSGTGLKKRDIPEAMMPGLVLVAQIKREAKRTTA
jgi:hypothetical protein